MNQFEMDSKFFHPADIILCHPFCVCLFGMHITPGVHQYLRHWGVAAEMLALCELTSWVRSSDSSSVRAVVSERLQWDGVSSHQALCIDLSFSKHLSTLAAESCLVTTS